MNPHLSQIATMLGMADGWTPEQVVERVKLDRDALLDAVDCGGALQATLALMGAPANVWAGHFGRAREALGVERGTRTVTFARSELQEQLRTSQKLATSQAEEIARLRAALVACVLPLETLCGQIKWKPYEELTASLQTEVVKATMVVRSALLHVAALAPVPASQAAAGEAEA